MATTVWNIGGASVSRWIETITVSGGAVSSVTFSNLDGDADYVYELEWYIIHAGVGSTMECRVRPNNTTTDQASVRSVASSTAHASSSSASFMFSTLARHYTAGLAVISATRAGSTHDRIMWAVGANHTVPEATTTSFAEQCSAIWDEMATNITSLVVCATDTGGTLQAWFANDTVFVLSKRLRG
jgi:hypothetical protein